MKRPHDWPEPPEEEKIPELSIGCPVCNDREHRMTIVITQDGVYQLGAWRTKFIKCNKCGSIFRLMRCNIETV